MKPHAPSRFPLRLQSENVETLFGAKIHDLATLRIRLPGSVLVAFDTEGVTQHFLGRQISSEEVGELGVAALRPSKVCLRRNLYQFYNDNDIEAFTIRIHERTLGPAVSLMTEKSSEDAGPRVL